MYSDIQSQTTVTAYIASKQLLLIFGLQESLLPSSNGVMTAVQKQTAVTAYFANEQLLLFAFATVLRGQRQTAVTAYFSSKQLLLFAFALQSCGGKAKLQ